MKLKTQKEIFKEHIKEYPDSHRALEFRIRERQEAINWIKELEDVNVDYVAFDNGVINNKTVKHFLDKFGFDIEYLDDEYDWNNERVSFLIRFIMYFFNITEDDLK